MSSSKVLAHRILSSKRLTQFCATTVFPVLLRAHPSLHTLYTAITHSRLTSNDFTTVLLEHIFSYLSIRAFSRITRVCKRFHLASRRAPLSTRAELTTFLPEYAESIRRLRHGHFQVTLNHFTRVIPYISRLESILLSGMALIKPEYGLARPPSPITMDFATFFHQLREHCPRMTKVMLEDDDLQMVPCTETVPSVESLTLVNLGLLPNITACFPNLTSLSVLRRIGHVRELVQILPQLTLLHTLDLKLHSHAVSTFTPHLLKLALRRLKLHVCMRRPDSAIDRLAILSSLVVDRLTIKVSLHKGTIEGLLRGIFGNDGSGEMKVGASKWLRIHLEDSNVADATFKRTISRKNVCCFSSSRVEGFPDMLARVCCVRDPDLIVSNVLPYVHSVTYRGNDTAKLTVNTAPGLWKRIESEFVHLMCLVFAGRRHVRAPWGGRRPFSRGMLPALRELRIEPFYVSGSCVYALDRLTRHLSEWNDIVFSKLSVVRIQLGCAPCQLRLQQWFQTHTVFNCEETYEYGSFRVVRPQFDGEET